MNATAVEAFISSKRIRSPTVELPNSVIFTSPATTCVIVELKMNSTVVMPLKGSLARTTLAQLAGQELVSVSTNAGSIGSALAAGLMIAVHAAAKSVTATVASAEFSFFIETPQRRILPIITWCEIGNPSQALDFGH